MLIFHFPPTPSHRDEKAKISGQKQEHGFKITVLYFIFYPTPYVSELEIYVAFYPTPDVSELEIYVVFYPTPDVSELEIYVVFYPTPDVSELEIYVVFVVIIESQVDDRTIQQTPNPAAQLPDPLPPQEIH